MIQLEKYILNSIDLSEYGIHPKTTEEKILETLKVFESEKGYEIDRVGRLQALEDWLRGLPTCINIEWESYKILKFAESMGILKDGYSDPEADEVLEAYFPTMAKALYFILYR